MIVDNNDVALVISKLQAKLLGNLYERTIFSAKIFIDMYGAVHIIVATLVLILYFTVTGDLVKILGINKLLLRQSVTVANRDCCFSALFN